MKCFGSSSTATTALLVSLAMSSSTNAFTTKAPSPRQNQMSLHSDATSDRKTMLSKGFGLLGISAALTGGPSEALASYSAYTNREKDWEVRKASGGKLFLLTHFVQYILTSKFTKCYKHRYQYINCT